jgi:hypothetical protein
MHSNGELMSSLNTKLEFTSEKKDRFLACFIFLWEGTVHCVFPASQNFISSCAISFPALIITSAKEVCLETDLIFIYYPLRSREIHIWLFYFSLDEHDGLPRKLLPHIYFVVRPATSRQGSSCRKTQSLVKLRRRDPLFRSVSFFSFEAYFRQC